MTSVAALWLVSALELPLVAVLLVVAFRDR